MSEVWGEFQRVIAVGAEKRPDAGGRLYVLSLAVWEHGMVLYSAERLPEFEPPNPGGHMGWQVTDDVGTTYRLGGGSRTGRDQELALSDDVLTPSPPENATKLFIIGPRMDPDDVIEVDLRR
jgi:hypothetical protein